MSQFAPNDQGIFAKIYPNNVTVTNMQPIFPNIEIFADRIFFIIIFFPSTAVFSFISPGLFIAKRKDLK